MQGSSCYSIGFWTTPTGAIRIANFWFGIVWLRRKPLHHLLQILHLDVKSPNILLNKGLSAKISDIGLGRMVKQEGATTLSKLNGPQPSSLPLIALLGPNLSQHVTRLC